MIDQLVETWMINNRINLLLLSQLGKAELECSLSTRGGRTVGQQLAHLCTVRRSWIEVADKKLLADVPSIVRDDGHDKSLLTDGFVRSAEILADVIRRAAANDGKVKGFKRGIIPMV